MDNIQNKPASYAKAERSFTNLEVVFAWMCYFAGYLFCRTVPINDHPLGTFLFICGLYITTIIVLLIKKTKISLTSWLAVAISLFTASSFIIISNDAITLFAYLFTLTTYFYFVYSATGNSIRKGLSDMIIVDYLNAFFAFPFRSIGQMTKAMFSNKTNKSSKLISRSLLGLVIALIPTIIVLSLLSYDSNFWNLFNSIFDFSIGDIFSHLVSFGFAFPIGMFIYGLFFSSINKQNIGAITEESCKKTANQIRFLPTATVVAAVTPIIIIYVIFFASQWNYYISGFTGILPDGFSYSEYAREGFFQLCAVSVINLIVIIAASLFMRRPTEKPPMVLKIINVIFSLFTLVLISTAIAKMAMYIDSYGLTPKRVYSSCFMIVLTIIFIIIILKQFIGKLHAIAASFVVCVLAFSCLSLANADKIIVNYNVDRYLNGTLTSINFYDMSDMGDSAISGLVRLYEEMDESDEDYDLLRSELISMASQIRIKADEKSFFSFNFPAREAEAALRKIGFLK